ncbi:hypothetical protein MKEN_01339700 [Mycena kentingensis (nom. inval.)]|nr:hypothetical protein MKEN_01339700 [Mycena kentingensis (nom. inval.)]
MSMPKSPPILSVPFDITSRILRLAPGPPSYPTIWSLFQHRVSLAPLALSAVCTQWRSVALSTPLLWSTLILDCNSVRSPDELVALWLQRAGDVALTLHIRLPVTNVDPDLVVQRLLECARRWKRVTVQTCGVKFPLDGLRLPLENLESFGIFHGYTESQEATEASKIVAPNLRELAIDRVPSQTSTVLPVHQLTALELYGPFLAPTIEFLRHTPNLETLRITQVTLDAESPSTHPQCVLLPNLTVFEDGYLERPTANNVSLLPYLTLPALVDLRLSFVPVATDELDRLSNLLTRSGCTLRVLSIRNTHVASVRAIQSIFPDLHRLQLYAPAFPPAGAQLDEICERLSNGFPEMKDLVLVGWGERALPTLAQCALNRWQVCRLQRFAYSWLTLAARERSAEVLTPLQDAERQGLVLQLDGEI